MSERSYHGATSRSFIRLMHNKHLDNQTHTTYTDKFNISLIVIYGVEFEGHSTMAAHLGRCLYYNRHEALGTSGWPFHS